MKKLLSLVMALLMLAMPVFSMAEGAVDAAAVSDMMSSADFTTKYLAEGQEATVTVSLKLGDFVLSAIPESYQEPVKDLLDALKIRMTAQGSDKEGQFGLHLLVNDTDAVNGIVAVGEDGLYAGSNLLADKIVKITPEQMKQLAEKAAEAAGMKDQYDAIMAKISEFSKDPQAAIKELIGNPDPSALLAAIQGMMGEMAVDDLSEVPESLPFTPAMGIKMPLKKEGLKNVTTELGKLLWSMPIVQKIAAQMNSGATEETLVAKLNSIPDLLKDDFEIKVYMSENGSSMAVVAQPVLIGNETDIPVNVLAVVDTRADGAHILWNVVATNDKLAEEIAVNGDVNVVMEGTDGSMAVKETLSMTENGESLTMLDETIDASWSISETEHKMNMNARVQIQQSADATPIALLVTADVDEQDLGDHAAETAVVNYAIEGLGDFMTITCDVETGLAEAYIISDDAVEVMALSEEDQQAFLQEAMGSVSSVLMNLINALPESVQPIVMSMLSGAQ